MTGKQIETTPIRWGLVLFVNAEKTLSVAIRQPPPPGLIEELYRNADELDAVLLDAREAQRQTWSTNRCPTTETRFSDSIFAKAVMKINSEYKEKQ